MVAENVGRLIVVARTMPAKLVGILTRGDLLSAHSRRLKEARDAERHIRIRQTIEAKVRSKGVMQAGVRHERPASRPAFRNDDDNRIPP